jgi:hypothetical protein
MGWLQAPDGFTIEVMAGQDLDAPVVDMLQGGD